MQSKTAYGWENTRRNDKEMECEKLKKGGIKVESTRVCRKVRRKDHGWKMEDVRRTDTECY